MIIGITRLHENGVEMTGLKNPIRDLLTIKFIERMGYPKTKN